MVIICIICIYVFIEQKQIEEYRNLIAKYQATEGSRSLIETIESKLLDLQSKLRTLQESKDKSTIGPSGAPPQQQTAGGSFYPRGGSSFYGRGSSGRGRFDSGARGTGSAGRGGRGGRVTGNLTLDNRTKTLLVSNSPVEFEKHAAAHFAR